MRALLHEVANAVAAIRLSGYFLGTALSEPDRVSMARDVELLASQAGALLAAVRPVLAPSDDRRARVEVLELLDGILGLVEGGVAPGRLVVARSRGLPAVHVDADALQHLLVLLVTYALLSGRPGGRVRVRARKVGSRVAFSVTDAGTPVGAVPVAPARGRELALQLAASVLQSSGGSLRTVPRRRGNEVLLLVPQAPKPARKRRA